MQCDWKALRNAVIVMPGTKSSEGAVEIVLPGRQYACGNAHVLWRSAFQARRPRLAFPGTAYPAFYAYMQVKLQKSYAASSFFCSP